MQGDMEKGFGMRSERRRGQVSKFEFAGRRRRRNGGKVMEERGRGRAKIVSHFTLPLSAQPRLIAHINKYPKDRDIADKMFQIIFIEFLK